MELLLVPTILQLPLLTEQRLTSLHILGAALGLELNMLTLQHCHLLLVMVFHLAPTVLLLL
jgi:hypothetical protein